MRIAIQASDLDHARIDGTRVYLKELLARFGALSPEIEFLLYHAAAFNPLLAPPDYSNYIERRCPFPLAWMQTRFPRELFREQPDKLFLPIQAAPVLLPRRLEVTATIHDLAFKKYPETFPRTDLLKLNLLLDIVVKRADKLITVSSSTKNDLLRHFPWLPEERVRVIHHGFDPSFLKGSTEGGRTLEDLGLQADAYALYLGALQPRKNLIRLIRAFGQVKKRLPEMKLALAGEVAWLADDILAERARSPYREDILMLGQVSFGEARRLYRGAKIFVFPSLYEGFGLPILEAFASGTPVLTAANSSLREVGGEGALYCSAESVEDIAEKLSLLWRDGALRERLIEQGRRELARFSWDRAAEETLRFLQT